MMDEPLGALDSEFRELMCQELRALHDRLHATTVYVTHDQLEAMAMADTIAIMNQGLIEQLGAPQEVYDRPASVFVADFIGSPAMNFLPLPGGYTAGARQLRLGETLLSVPALREDAPGAQLLLGVRPEHVHFSAESSLRAEVLGTEYLGSSQIVTCRVAQGTTLRARVAPDLAVQRGDQLGLAFDAAQLSVFDAGSGRALRTARHDDGAATRSAPSVTPLGAFHG
jgi:multiple sugar transport system ATP-binding protein